MPKTEKGKLFLSGFGLPLDLIAGAKDEKLGRSRKNPTLRSRKSAQQPASGNDGVERPDAADELIRVPTGLSRPRGLSLLAASVLLNSTLGFLPKLQDRCAVAERDAGIARGFARGIELEVEVRRLQRAGGASGERCGLH